MSERLTDEECEDLLIAAHTVEPMHHVGNALIAAVERILASRDERLAAVEALAAKWLAERDAPFGDAHMSYAYAQHELHAALRSDPSERA